ncbi:hypothetical protein JCM8115_000714 [Rhodotorula mucilaginosa]|uniref:Mitogen-activated protein kinase n=1 Tax=Rhodotorula mucilaginosa TaxID=5537 RepID=A0A9P6VYL5_RHOMI|nr:MAP kinase Pmk1 [Rhodotorula mucilaginosa]TKA54339.1 Mitogen-activated protein kinase 2 [Rhodotorula sp. CCFEE 5036]
MSVGASTVSTIAAGLQGPTRSGMHEVSTLVHQGQVPATTSGAGPDLATMGGKNAAVEAQAPQLQQQEQPAPAADNPTERRRIRFSVGDKYRVLEVIGEGAYGVVCSAIHRASGQRVAIKKIAPFDHSMFALRTLRELKLLRFFAENQVSENLITVVDIIKPPSFDSFQEVYLVQELMETDLHRVIRTQTLSDDHVQYFVYQTLRALKALHSVNIIHRDLKPSNLLLNANCDLKICDFGLARSVTTAEPASGSQTGFMTEYVATRWYRAPEIMLTFRQYTKAVDIWSVGCICAEMLNSRPLFPGRDYHHQLTLILSVTGTPTPDEFYRITSRRSRDYLRALPFQQPRDFAQIYPHASPEAVDFLQKTLAFDPLKRITVEQALEHPYMANYHDPIDEPVAPPLEPGFFDFDLQKPDREALRASLFEEVMAFQPLV